jgi:NADH-quinone oxidoreductase subunit N
VFVGLELMSVCLYVLAGFLRKRTSSGESALKYFLLGAFVTGFLLYGIALMYGASGTTDIDALALFAASGEATLLFWTGTVLFLGAIAFKIGAFPFHMWIPDVYEGAPTPVTAFLSVASKAAGFVALVTIVFIAFAGADDVVEPLIWVLSALTMTIGNVLALRQTNIVRLLAYSSVSQGGFILMPLAYAGNENASGAALNAVVVYLLVYAFMNLGAFAVVIAVARKTHSGEISSFGGLFSYAPGLAVSLTIFFASLAGIPPLGGWYAKFNAFRAVLDAETTSAYVLAAIAAVNTVIAAAYYMRVLRVVWMDDVPDGDTTPIHPPAPIMAALGITVIGTLVIGILPGLLARFGDVSDLTGALAP